MFNKIKTTHLSPTLILLFIGIVIFQMFISKVSISSEQIIKKVDGFSQFSIEVFGQSDREAQSVILIPGLMSDGRVWVSLVQQLSTRYQVHVVNIAGFGKKPAINHFSLASVKNQLSDYIDTNQLQYPAVVGHSLGGFMGFWLASEKPKQIGAVISVDGLPFVGPVFTRSNSTSVQDLVNQATQIRTLYGTMSSAQMVAQSRYTLPIQVSHDNGKALVMEMVESSDPKTMGEAIYSLMSTDLRESIANIEAPTLLLGATGGFTKQREKDQVKTLYTEQLSTLPNAKLVMHNDARHFIMLDDPTWLNQQVMSFLQENFIQHPSPLQNNDVIPR